MFTHSPESTWRRSTRCDSSTCFELTSTADEVLVRDSADPGRHVSFTPMAWREFLASVRSDEFDPPR
jgi:Domain of unknown function (DUF397)